MRLQRVPAARGTVWVRMAFRTFFQRPMAFASLFAAFMFTTLLLSMLPVVGLFLLPALFPLVTLGFMIATRITSEGGFPTPRVFIDPLRGQKDRVRAIWQLCAICAALIVAGVWLSDVLDGGAFEDQMDALAVAQGTSQEAFAEAFGQAIAAPGFFGGLMLRYALVAALLLPFWHASALVYWGGYGCAQALFSTTIAWWRNRGALLMFALTWFALFMGILMVGVLVVSVIGQPQILVIGALSLLLLFATLFYVSLYFTFADSYVMPEAVLAAEPT